MATYTDELNHLRTLESYDIIGELDGLGLGTPERDGDGERMVLAARDALLEAVGCLDDLDDLDRLEDEIGEMMDSVPSVYTATIWRTYVDLEAYGCDLYRDAYGEDVGDDMTRVAHITLILICEAIGRYLLSSLIAARDEDREADELDDDLI